MDYLYSRKALELLDLQRIEQAERGDRVSSDQAPGHLMAMAIRIKHDYVLLIVEHISHGFSDPVYLILNIPV